MIGVSTLVSFFFDFRFSYVFHLYKSLIDIIP